MSKRLKIYIGIFVLVIGLLMYLEYTRPQPVNWTQNYSAKDKIPFGTYIAFNELSKMFPDKNINLIEKTPASYLVNDHKNKPDNLYFIISKFPSLSDTDTDFLLDFVNTGNDVFLVSNNVSKEILTALELEVNSSDFILEEDFSKVRLYLTNPAFNKTHFKFEKISNYYYFSKLNLEESIILGEYSTPSEARVNFIKQKYGKGYFYIHLFPEAYSNYFMLKDDNYSYAINSLSYIDKNNILWEENKKSIDTPPEGIMKYIFSNPPLLWAWRILVVSAIFYALFFGKRLQRIIPVIKPLKNTTVEFTKTIGNLYYNNREHQDIINKKIKYFLYFVKEHYYIDIDSEKINETFSEKLHLKSGVSKEITDKIVFLIKKNQNSSFLSEEDLKTINSTIDLFYKKINK